VIVFKVDNMEEINEKAGHVAGQRILQNFATELQRSLRITDTCSRYGMDKILAVLANTNREQAEMTCEKLAKEEKIREILETQPQRGFCLSVSVGVAEAESTGDMQSVVGTAEEKQSALYDFRVCTLEE
jgi:phospholipid/cholesterol/gamma-HCH transport system ATP-binding protein